MRAAAPGSGQCGGSRPAAASSDLVRTRHGSSTVRGQSVAAYTVDGDSFRPEQPRLWSAGRYVERAGLRPFDLDPDGERFALAPLTQMPAEPTQEYLHFIFDFFEELRRIAPITKR